MTREGRIINSHDRIFLSKCSLGNKKTLQRRVLTFLTEFACEAVHALALLPRPVVQAGAPVSAGAGGAGSFQSRTSTDTQTDNQTVRQSVSLTSQLHSRQPGVGGPTKKNLQK